MITKIIHHRAWRKGWLFFKKTPLRQETQNRISKHGDVWDFTLCKMRVRTCICFERKKVLLMCRLHLEQCITAKTPPICPALPFSFPSLLPPFLSPLPSPSFPFPSLPLFFPSLPFSLPSLFPPFFPFSLPPLFLCFVFVVIFLF